MRILLTTLLPVAAMAAVAGYAGSARATTFAAWEVANVAFGDTLNVRKYPSSNSQKQASYPNGTVLQMTGRCTGGVNLLDIAYLPDWKQAEAIRYRWCEVWHDPARNGKFVTGWAYGRYLRPA
ncbi:MAG: SH3 domain-containing protein [Rhizobiaceae bacterium]|nr:SH3 domain-containing protein [Rhizobiaceae bacterium]